MIIPLTKPLTYLFNKKLKSKKTQSSKIFNLKNLKVEPFNDKRFKIRKYLNYLKISIILKELNLCF